MTTFKKINKAEEIDMKVQDTTEVLNKPEHKKAVQEMNEAMEAVRREYKVKESKSQTSAANVILTS
ncbi:MAG: hypothetical protein WDO16_00550 [Bacteroidota bacterium]